MFFMMRNRWIVLGATAALALGSAWAGLSYGPRSEARKAEAPLVPAVRLATGFVFHDANKNGKRDPGERGLGGVRVSNRRDFATTNAQGRWQLPIPDENDSIFFVVKPGGWRTEVDPKQLPRFYYIHKPKGSPKSRYPGVAPTGPLPASIDFPLQPQEESRSFRALFFGDTQPRNVREVDYIRHDIVEPLIGKTDAKFGVTLGDIVFDDLSVFEPLIDTIALLGLPWYNVLGNHDINYDSPDDAHSDETFERYFGPNYYSFDHGPVHFVVLDNVHYAINPETKRGGYTGAFGKEQLEWVKKDLAFVPESKLLVLMMHIPLTGTRDREDLYRLIEKRPYSLSVSAHTHYQEHHFIGAKDGWKGREPHHHVVNVTTCGSWWQGSPDEYGIPHATMRDGAPNGYAIFSFDGNQYSIEFRAARRPPTYQMRIMAPEVVVQGEAAQTVVSVNVFGGTEKSKVEMKVGEGKWLPMTRALRPDPDYQQMYDRDKELKTPYRALPAPIDSPHLWEAKLPAGLPKGMLPIHVRTTDMFGQVYLATRGITLR